MRRCLVIGAHTRRIPDTTCRHQWPSAATSCLSSSRQEGKHSGAHPFPVRICDARVSRTRGQTADIHAAYESRRPDASPPAPDRAFGPPSLAPMTRTPGDFGTASLRVYACADAPMLRLGVTPAVALELNCAVLIPPPPPPPLAEPPTPAPGCDGTEGATPPCTRARCDIDCGLLAYRRGRSPAQLTAPTTWPRRATAWRAAHMSHATERICMRGN